MTILDERTDRGHIELALGAKAILRLGENPSTGYRWRVESAGAPALTIDDDHYEGPPDAKLGAPGHHVWTLRAVATGASALRLEYRRSFGGAARTFTAAVTVR